MAETVVVVDAAASKLRGQKESTLIFERKKYHLPTRVLVRVTRTVDSLVDVVAHPVADLVTVLGRPLITLVVVSVCVRVTVATAAVEIAQVKTARSAEIFILK